ncbi:PrsW family intramembrane metalloprotease [Patescibacteria group bacterium]|nr:PrsW family intramembrane metalloprotease [Patescibacteria group bacterium]
MPSELILLVLISLAPIVILIWYFDHLDKIQKESRRLLWSIFAWGVSMTVVAGIAEYFLETNVLPLIPGTYFKLFVLMFIFVAGVEEGLKYWVVKKKAYDHPAFNEYFDGIIYAVMASLGFAALENVFYVTEYGFYIGAFRAITAVPAHAMFGAIMGYYISLARHSKDSKLEKKYLFKGIFLAIALHGIYDFLLVMGVTEPPINLTVILVIPFLLAMALNVKWKIAHLHFLDKAKGVIEPLKWTISRYIKAFFGLGIFTIGTLAALAILLSLFSGDPEIQSIFAEGEFSIVGTGIFVAIMWIIAYLLLADKRTSKQ